MTTDIGGPAVRGQVLRDGDPGYEEARAHYNGLVERRPALVVRVSGADDVVEALRFAREHGLEVSVRGGGHGVAGRALGGDLVIDLSAMDSVTVDEHARTATVQGGATWAAVDRATQVHGLAVPGGRFSQVGVAGLTLGGGIGWLSAKYGLTCDNLLGVELVTADGRVVRVSDDSEPELMWALRGGGGNFGVVTSFTFRLHPVGPEVVGGRLAYRLDDAPAVLELVGRLGEAGASALFVTAPPAPFVPAEVVGRPVLAVGVACFGDPESAGEVLAPLRTLVEPLFDTVEALPYGRLQSLMDGAAVSGLRNAWAARLTGALPPELVAVLQESATRMPGPMSHIGVTPIPSAVSGEPALPGAFPGRSGARWMVHPVAAWSSADGDAAAREWLGAITSAVPATGRFLNMEDPDDVRQAMGEDRYRRLQQVKSHWDPQDVFHHCAHISPQ